ncbi:hypothetical protein ACQY0O_005390 [Thecaphora frezii]
MSSSTDTKATKASKTTTTEDGEREAFVDFTALSSSALHSYISYYDLAQSYPPPDTTHSSSDRASSSSAKGRHASLPTASSAAATTTTTSGNGAGAPSSSSSSTSAGRKRNAEAAGLDGASATATKSAAAASAAAAVEDDPPCPPHFFDADAASLYLSQVAAKHFASQPAPKEGEVVVSFLYKCKAKGELNRPLAHHRIKGTRVGPTQGPAMTSASKQIK